MRGKVRQEYVNHFYIMNLTFDGNHYETMFLFLQDSNSIIAPTFGIRCTQNSQIRRYNGPEENHFYITKGGWYKQGSG